MPVVLKSAEAYASEAKIAAPAKARLAEAVDRAISLYESWGKMEKAAELRSRLGMSDLPADHFTR
jgi:hypothetical protein